MCNKLWFLTQNESIFDLYDDADIAAEEKVFPQKESLNEDIPVRTISMTRITEYSYEFEPAGDRGHLYD